MLQNILHPGNPPSPYQEIHRLGDLTLEGESA